MIEWINNYAAYEYAVASSQLFLAMLGMGALLSTQDFFAEVRSPKALALGLSMQWLLVPLLAVAIGSLLPMPAGIAVGLILVAAVPGGTLSNILTLVGRGNIALSIALTSITTVAALLTTPVLMKWLASQYLPPDFSMPVGQLARDILLTLILPLVIGMTIKRHSSEQFAVLFSRWAIRLSLSLIVVMVIGAAGSGRLDSNAYGFSGFMALVTLCFTLQIAAMLVTSLARLPMANRLAITVEVAFRNTSLGVAVKAILFPAQPGELDPIGDAVLFTLILYGGISLIMTSVPVLISRWLTRPQA